MRHIAVICAAAVLLIEIGISQSINPLLQFNRQQDAGPVAVGRGEYTPSCFPNSVVHPDSTVDQVTVSITTDVQNPFHLIVGAIPNYRFFQTQGVTSRYISDDQGKTWTGTDALGIPADIWPLTPSVATTQFDEGENHSNAAYQYIQQYFDLSGVESRYLVSKVSSDGGNNFWGEFGVPFLRERDYLPNYAQVVSDDNPTSPYLHNLYSVWTDFSIGQPHPLHFSRSTTGGIEWAGFHTFKWNAERFASGIYIARVTIGDDFGRTKFVGSRKMLLLR